MISTIQRLGGQLIDANVSIPEMLSKIANKADTVKELWAVAKEKIDSVLPAVLFALILVGLSLVEVFLGKKLIGVQKVIVSFALGFIIGTAYIYPVLATALPSLDKLIVGVVVGTIAALLCRPIYFVVYVGGFGYLAYFLMVSGCMLPDFTGNKIVGAAVAGVVIALCLIFRKVVEIACSSLLGGLFTSMSVGALVVAISGNSLDAHFGDTALIIKLAIILGVSIFGFVVQYRTRRRW